MTQQCGILHGTDVAVYPRMIEGRHLAQDLNQVLGSKLAGSAAGWNELRQSNLAQTILQPVAKRDGFPT